MSEIDEWCARHTAQIRAYDEYLGNCPRYENGVALGRYLESLDGRLWLYCTDVSYTFLDDEAAVPYYFLSLPMSLDLTDRVFNVLICEDLFRLIDAVLGFNGGMNLLPLPQVLRVLLRAPKIELLARLCRE